MKTVLVTGSRGFIGKNLVEGLQRIKDIAIKTIDRGEPISKLEVALEKVDVIFHLAGVNRPQEEKEFAEVNAGLTRDVIKILDRLHKWPAIVLASSTQAELDNPYGISKKKAEDILVEYGKESGAPVYIYRLPNVFGKWCRPNYNSVVATFCHNIAHGLDITISDSNKVLELVYIDDVISSFISILNDNNESTVVPYMTIKRTYKITLGELVDKLYNFRDLRKTLDDLDAPDDITKCLYATYLSYLDKEDKLR